MRSPPPRSKSALTAGFTLIELSIVLVIIGLIIGGVLVGRDLIAAAAVRAQISQIEKYQTAVNTFRLKFNALPGDMNSTTANAFGFAPRGSQAGQGDGNGALEGWNPNSTPQNLSYSQGGGETSVFWVDLSTANLIGGGFNTAQSASAPAGTVTLTSTPSLNDFLPAAQIGQGNYVYAWGGYTSTPTGYTFGPHNWFSISVPTRILVGFSLATNPGISVVDAYNIDKKIDDGQPMTGTVLAGYIIGTPHWASPGNHHMDSTYSAALAGSSTTCFDNGGNAANPWAYSLNQNNGNGINCGLSFQFQ